MPLVLSIGGVPSNAVQIAVQPPSADQRADSLITQMTQDEKLQLVAGASGQVAPLRGGAGYVPGIPRLGIPNLYLADGSVGPQRRGTGSALPSSLASAASWDLTEAAKYGSVIGSELRAYGINVNLGGNINLIGREPRDGRTLRRRAKILSWPVRSPLRTSRLFRLST